MPQRFLRPGITNSERWNRLDWMSQSFFIRLMTLVDDYGRYDGRASVLWGQCFAVWNEHNPDDAVNLLRVEQMLQRLAAEKLIEHYEADGKKVLQITQWQERVRDGARERWPKNPDPQQSAATRSNSLPPSSPPSPSSPPTPSPSGVGGRKDALCSAGSIPDSNAGAVLRAMPLPNQPNHTSLPHPSIPVVPAKPNGVLDFLKVEIGAAYNRPATQRWTCEEEFALAEVARRPDAKEEWLAIRKFRKELPPDRKPYFQQSVSALLRDWTTALDRARSQKTAKHRTL
jgi:hypothetical protein